MKNVKVIVIGETNSGKGIIAAKIAEVLRAGGHEVKHLDFPDHGGAVPVNVARERASCIDLIPRIVTVETATVGRRKV